MNEKARAVRLMIFDVDGVMTDGGLHYSDAGDEIKVFHTLDGLGMKLLKESGVRLAIITGRTSKIVQRRVQELGIDFLYQGAHDKLSAFQHLLAEAGVSAEQCAYMGDDIVDLPVMRRVGFAVAVPDSPELVRSHADYVTGWAGGRGAVREACEVVMQAQGTFDAAMAAYLA